MRSKRWFYSNRVENKQMVAMVGGNGRGGATGEEVVQIMKGLYEGKRLTLIHGPVLLAVGEFRAEKHERVMFPVEKRLGKFARVALCGCCSPILVRCVRMDAQCHRRVAVSKESGLLDLLLKAVECM